MKRVLGLLLISGAAMGASFEEDLVMTEGRLAEAQRNAANINLQIQKATAQIGSNTKEIGTSKDKIAKMPSEGVLKGKLDAAQKEVDIATAERDRVQAQIAPAEDPLMDQERALISAIEEYSSNIQSAENQISSTNSEIAQMKRRMSQLGTESSLMALLSQRRSELSSRQIEADRIRRDVDRRTRDLDREIDRMERDRQESRMRIGRMESEIEEIDRRINEIRLIENRIREFERRNGQLQGRLGEINRKAAELDAAIAATQDPNELARLQRERSEMDRQRANTESEIAQNIAAIQQLQSQQASGNSEIPRLNQQRDRLAREIEEIRRRDRESEHRIVEMRREMEVLANQVREADSRVDYAASLVSQTENDLMEFRDLASRVPTLERHVDELESYVAQNSAAKAGEQKKLAVVQAKLFEVRKPLVIVQNKLNGKVSIRNSAAAELQLLFDLRQNIVDLEEDTKQQNALIAAKKGELIAQEAVIESIRKEIQVLQVEVAYTGAVIGSGGLTNFDREKIDLLKLKALDLAALDGNQVIKRANKIVHLAATRLSSTLTETQQQILLQYLNSGGLLMIWGPMEKVLPKASKKEPAVTSVLRKVINSKTSKETQVKSLKGDYELGEVRFIGRRDNEKLPVFVVSELDSDVMSTPILKDADGFSRKVAIHTVLKTSNKEIPARAINIGLDFDRMGGEETDKLVDTLCETIKKKAPTEGQFRKVCNL